MKVIFNQSLLGEKVSTAMCCVSAKSTIASAEGLLLECDASGRCMITAFDLEKGMQLEMEAAVEEPGACIVNAQSFFSIVKNMPSAEFTLEVNDTWRAHVYSGKSEFEFSAMDPREFPTLPDLVNIEGFKIKQGDLKNMITQTLFAVAQNDARPTFNGALFRIQKNRITTVGCDSFRLAIREKICEMENAFEGDLNLSFIIPGKALSEAAKLLSDPDEIVSIDLNRKQVVFRMENRKMMYFSRLIEGDYIDYERIIPKNSTIFVDVDTATLEGALGRASLISDDSSGKSKSLARCKFGDNRLDITSISANGKVHDEISTSHTGDEIEIGFNCRYLTEALRASMCDKLHLSLSSPYISMIIEPYDRDENDRFMFLVLPCRLA